MEDKITMEDIFKTATMSVFQEHMEEAENLAHKIGELFVGYHFSSLLIALSMAKGAVLGALCEQDLDTIAHIKHLTDNITNHYEKAMREQMKKEGE